MLQIASFMSHVQCTSLQLVNFQFYNNSWCIFPVYCYQPESAWHTSKWWNTLSLVLTEGRTVFDNDYSNVYEFEFYLPGDQTALWAAGYAADSLVHQQQEVWEPRYSRCSGGHYGKCWYSMEGFIDQTFQQDLRSCISKCYSNLFSMGF